MFLVHTYWQTGSFKELQKAFQSKLRGRLTFIKMLYLETDEKIRDSGLMN
jgi:hypothetical protein